MSLIIKNARKGWKIGKKKNNKQVGKRQERVGL